MMMVVSFASNDTVSQSHRTCTFSSKGFEEIILEYFGNPRQDKYVIVGKVRF